MLRIETLAIGDERCRTARAADYHLHSLPVAALAVVEIHLVAARLLERSVADVGDDADDGRAAVLGDLLPDGITIGPELAREVLVDDDGLLARRGVAIVEEPARTQRDLHGLEIVLIDHAREDRRALPWRVLHAFRPDTPRPISAERQYIAQPPPDRQGRGPTTPSRYSFASARLLKLRGESTRHDIACCG